MVIERPRYMGTAEKPGYQDHFMAMHRARGDYGLPMSPPDWMSLSDREAFALFSHTRYLRARAELGFWSPESEGMVLNVWEGCEPDAQEHMARQLEDAVEAKRAEEKARPEGWGDW